MFAYDFCWCIDSEKCSKEDCFRHMNNYPKNLDNIFTSSHLMGTKFCPLTKESEEVIE